MKIVGCPLCGKKPRINDVGSYVAIECCVTFKRLNLDYLDNWKSTLTLNVEKLSPEYAPAIELNILERVIAEWNDRKRHLGEYDL